MTAVIKVRQAAGTCLMPISPGEVLLDEFLAPMNMEPEDFALSAGLPGITISRIVDGSVKIDSAMASCLSAALGTSKELWLNLQSNYDKANCQ